MPDGASTSASRSLVVVAYPLPWRAIAAVLVAVSGASLPLLLGLVLFSRTPIFPLMLMRAVTLLAVAPAIAGWLIARAFATTATVRAGGIVLERDAWRIEIPRDAIGGIAPWRVPLPGSGLSLRLRSGRRFAYGLQLADPSALLTALADADLDAARMALRHPGVVYAHARHAVPRSRWDRPLRKFVVFALVPTLPLFRIKQLVTYGGTFGQYYLRGWRPYAQSFAIYWATLTIYLVLYAAALRGVAEAAALFAAHVAPSRAARVRRVAEAGCRLLYYGGVPALLIRFFWP